RVMDVTDSSEVDQIPVTPAPDGAGSFAVTLRVPGTGSRTLLAFTGGTVAAPAYITPHRASSWHQADNAADYVVVTHASFAASVAPLAARRAQEGHRVALVDVDDVYAEFSFGEKTPQAIKDFLGRARSTWKLAPRFVVLVGDATI